MGMDAETVARAFEPFFTTKPKEKGSGLGLATVYGIVAQAGGAVNLYSEVGIGTVVTILLPSVSSPIVVAEPASVATHRHGGETILIVEDEELVRDVASRILTRNGYRVLVAQNGSEALEVVAAHGGAIDLLLTDVVMPGLTGDQLAERIAATHPDILVLYMSGYPATVVTSEGIVQKGLRLMSKPFVERELLDNVRAVLDE
jgi:CheY-like chemotaxis protein